MNTYARCQVEANDGVLSDKFASFNKKAGAE
jgi:hypothetical protein